MPAPRSEVCKLNVPFSYFYMTAPKQILIDPLSTCSLLIQTLANDQPLGTATGFCVRAKDMHLLITNWHVVAGRNPETNELLSETGAIPDQLRIVHHSAAGLGKWIIRSEKLYASSGSQRWIEHRDGHSVDVVALPLSSVDAQVTIYPFDLNLADFDMVVQVAMPVSIIGFPFGLSTGGAWPIWKTGHIASDPDLDYDKRPAFLIDATTRGGMSGSPVVLRIYGGYATSKAAMSIGGGPGTRFLGVYSGRIHGQAEIGRVWRPSVIHEILATSAKAGA